MGTFTMFAFMQQNSEERPNALPEQQAQLWGLFVLVGAQGAEELRKELTLDEMSFRHLAPNLNGEPKQYFLYRVLDEIQKAALRIADWKEYLSEDGLDKLQRIDYESVIDDQQFRARKLAEVLVDAILFSTTNDQDHYGDYFFLYELNECARSQEDREEFFGFQSENTQWSANWLFDEIRRLEKAGLDPRSRWYVKQGSAVKREWTTRGVPFSSFRQRYKQVLPVALPNELNVLGKSYVHAYGMSKDVHFTPHDTSSGFMGEEVFHGVDRVGLLILALIIRCQHLLGRVPEGVNKRYREMHDSNTEPAKLVQALRRRPAEEGDIVWIQGDYAEVLNVTTSKYGYPAYQVRYIEHSPLPEVPEDWFAGFEVRLAAKRITVEKAADAVAEDIQKSTGECENRAKLLNYAKLAVIRLSTYQQQRRLQISRSASIGASGPVPKPGIPPKANGAGEPPALPAQ